MCTTRPEVYFISSKLDLSLRTYSLCILYIHDIWCVVYNTILLYIIWRVVTNIVLVDRYTDDKQSRKCACVLNIYNNNVISPRPWDEYSFWARETFVSLPVRNIMYSVYLRFARYDSPVQYIPDNNVIIIIIYNIVKVYIGIYVCTRSTTPEGPTSPPPPTAE